MFCNDEDELKKHDIKYIENVSVLGSGDMYASAFIKSSLSNKSIFTDSSNTDAIKSSMIYAHKNVSEHLSKRQSLNG